MTKCCRLCHEKNMTLVVIGRKLKLKLSNKAIELAKSHLITFFFKTGLINIHIKWQLVSCIYVYCKGFSSLLFMIQICFNNILMNCYNSFCLFNTVVIVQCCMEQRLFITITSISIKTNFSFWFCTYFSERLPSKVTVEWISLESGRTYTNDDMELLFADSHGQDKSSYQHM